MSREELEFLQEEDGLNDSGIPVTPQAGEYHEGMGALGSNSPIVGRSRKEKRFQDPNSPTRVSDSSPKRSTSRVQSHKDPGDPAVANDVFQSKVKMSPLLKSA